MEVNRKINVVKTEAFHKIMIDFIFTVERNKDFSLYGNILVRMLTKKTKKYPEEEAFLRALVEHYVMDFSLSKGNCGENWFYTYHVVLPDKLALKEKSYDYQKTLQFVMESIYAPFGKENSFDDAEVEIAKNKLKMYIESAYKNIKSYASIRMDDLVDDCGYFSDSLFQNKEQLETISKESLYKYYKETIQGVCPLVFVVGNVDKEFLDAVENSLPKKKEALALPYQVKPFLVNEKVKKEEECKEYSQSIVKFAYKIENYQKEDMVMLSILRFLLDSQSSGILIEYLRMKEKLVYTANSDFSSYYGLFYITAQIYREKKEKAIETIKEVMHKLEDKEFIYEKLERIKMRKRVNLERQKDTISSYMSDLQRTYFGSAPTFLEEYEMIKKITAEDLISFVKRMRLDTIYYLEGCKDE